MRIDGSEAHKNTQDRWLRANFSAKAGIAELDLGIGYDDIEEFLAPLLTMHTINTFPYATPSQVITMTGRMLGFAITLAAVLVEQDRIQHGHT